MADMGFTRVGRKYVARSGNRVYWIYYESFICIWTGTRYGGWVLDMFVKRKRRKDINRYYRSITKNKKLYSRKKNACELSTSWFDTLDEAIKDALFWEDHKNDWGKGQ